MLLIYSLFTPLYEVRVNTLSLIICIEVSFLISLKLQPILSFPCNGDLSETAPLRQYP